MLRGFDTAVTGMLVQRQRMDVITNNLTNADTTAFKSDYLVSGSFKDLVIEKMNDDGEKVTVGNLGLGVKVNNILTSFEQGTIEETGRSCDFALEGPGFFEISTPDGTRYTRDGSFYVTGDGYLATSDGYYVQGRNGRIYVGSGGFSSDEQGNITVGGTVTDKLRVVMFSDLTTLRKEGNSLYRSSQNPVADTETKVKQGWLESSNVDISGTLSDMMSVSNVYQSNQRVLRMIDGTLDKAVNEVGKV
jgi:flagellar basal-body rod protein FlgF